MHVGFNLQQTSPSIGRDSQRDTSEHRPERYLSNKFPAKTSLCHCSPHNDVTSTEFNYNSNYTYVLLEHISVPFCTFSKTQSIFQL
jgi:hypothetical protein